MSLLSSQIQIDTSTNVLNFDDIIEEDFDYECNEMTENDTVNVLDFDDIIEEDFDYECNEPTESYMEVHRGSQNEHEVKGL